MAWSYKDDILLELRAKLRVIFERQNEISDEIQALTGYGDDETMDAIRTLQEEKRQLHDEYTTNMIKH